MKIDKNIIKELTEYLNEFNLTEIEYTEKDTKIKVSKSNPASSNQVLNVATSTPIPDVAKSNVVSGTEVKSPIIGTAYLAAEPGAKKFTEVGKK
ncbi:acetyl-CoA carboxylase biotin carboxyl carrier protein subunit, partial [Candidatus Pelagibacter sp.]|nr:acetyl-CoA carboxylase biotin carboxyl carrier protein subunit [Candidatus Pelagibacter sp.]